MDGESIGPVVGGRARVASRIAMGALPQSRNAPVVTNGNDPRTRQRRASACMFRLPIHRSSPAVNGKRHGPNSQTISWIQYNWSSIFAESGRPRCRNRAARSNTQFVKKL
ncbi:hypothetical protein Bxe_B1412 [Paraburkholderia xenovorans LB400]|uniref:Uncharacterized protein n=1 Tax=Paraburkholderia xenovorans (strain LB400) TaxID=266265 RepID=Q13MY7_PARXL|nr:hypothetical protein Bxe_B1412 [Paraburkholderia xenovorans LB400]